MDPVPVVTRTLRIFTGIYLLVGWVLLAAFATTSWGGAAAGGILPLLAVAGVVVAGILLFFPLRKIARREKALGQLPAPRGWREQTIVFVLNYGVMIQIWFFIDYFFAGRALETAVSKALWMGIFFAFSGPRWLFPQPAKSTKTDSWPRWKWLNRKIPGT